MHRRALHVVRDAWPIRCASSWLLTNWPTGWRPLTSRPIPGRQCALEKISSANRRGRPRSLYAERLEVWFVEGPELEPVAQRPPRAGQIENPPCCTWATWPNLVARFFGALARGSRTRGQFAPVRAAGQPLARAGVARGQRSISEVVSRIRSSAYSLRNRYLTGGRIAVDGRRRSANLKRSLPAPVLPRHR